MSAKPYAYLNFNPSHQKLKIGLLVILAMAVIAGFHWMATEAEPVTAPLGVRVLDCPISGAGRLALPIR